MITQSKLFGCRGLKAKLLAATLALGCAVFAVGCSAPESSQADAPAADAARSYGADQQLPEEQVGEKSQAMVLVAGSNPLFVDTDTQSPYYPTIPANGVTDVDGNPISPDQLAVGNVVEVTGNGIMLESYPGQYPGITAVRVIDVGSPSAAEPYQQLIDQLTPGESDGVPYASMNYSTDLANTTVLLEPQAYTWTDASGASDSEELELLEADGSMDDDIIDARISAETAATVVFDVPADGVAITRMAVQATGSGFAVDSSVAEQAVQATLQGTEAAFTMEPDSLYVVTASFASGQVVYAFVTLQPGQ